MLIWLMIALAIASVAGVLATRQVQFELAAARQALDNERAGSRALRSELLDAQQANARLSKGTLRTAWERLLGGDSFHVMLRIEPEVMAQLRSADGEYFGRMLGRQLIEEARKEAWKRAPAMSFAEKAFSG